MLDEAAYFLLGNIKIYYYGLHIALGALAAVIVLALCCRARRMPAGAALLYAVLAMPLGVACSRVLFCLLDGRFRGIFSLRAMLCFWGGGHSMVGALLGAALAAVIAAKILAVPARRMLDMMVPALLVYIAFARVGVMTFGGGMAMLPILEREIVQNKKWATEEELVDYFAIGQCTPGIIAVNTATFIGEKKRGVLGGIAATLGVVFPSLVIITVLAGLITNFSHLAWVQNAFAGIQVCVCVLILNAVLKLLKKSVVDKRTALIFALVLLGSIFLSVSPVWFVLLAALSGIALKALEGRKTK